jgi:hypothetical protein
MAFRKSVVLQKLARRGSSKQLQRARQILRETPDGALSRRLGLEQGTVQANLAPQEPINRMGRQVKSERSSQLSADLRPQGSAERAFMKRTLPGSPFR